MELLVIQIGFHPKIGDPPSNALCYFWLEKIKKVEQNFACGSMKQQECITFHIGEIRLIFIG
jgi:hypothetical protein